MRDAFLGFPASLDPEPISTQTSNSNFEEIIKQRDSNPEQDAAETAISKTTATQLLWEVAWELYKFFSHPVRK